MTWQQISTNFTDFWCLHDAQDDRDKGNCMKLVPLIYGISTFIPGMRRLRRRGTGGTDSALYCYTVWLRHLVMAGKSGLCTAPRTVAELGPGDSIGIGLAALLSGTEQYYAFDVVRFANCERNLSIFEELVALYKKRTPIPGDDQWPLAKPVLDDYRFPSAILDGKRLHNALNDTRIARIRDSVRSVGSANSLIEYKVPWYGANVLKAESVDMIYSQAVLEHVDDLENTYRAMHGWLKPSGCMSHTIDFKCHGKSREWNGHWLYSDRIWKLIRGRRPFLLNREPYSTHLRLIRETGFDLTCSIRDTSHSRLNREQLAPRFRSMTQEDLVTSTCFIQARKTNSTGIPPHPDKPRPQPVGS